MSIYSGFSKRSLESSYNKALYNMIFLLQLKHARAGSPLHLTHADQFDEDKFAKHFSLLYQKLFNMEKYKHLPPKFSYSCKDLAEFYNVFEKDNSNIGSDYESDFSVTLISSQIVLPSPAMQLS